MDFYAVHDCGASQTQTGYERGDRMGSLLSNARQSHDSDQILLKLRHRY